MALTNYDYTNDLNKLKEAQKQAAVADLEKTRNQTLSDLNAESQKNAASYNTQRSSANAQNRLSAKNFQEYLATTGRANSGLAAQARLQNSNNLKTSINTLNAGEAAANADINRRTTDANNAYSSGIASANATIESNYIQNLLNERQKQFEREQAILSQQMQERQFNESIRQFNENLALQRQQLQQRFSSGSGGGGSSSGRNSSSKTSSSSRTSNSFSNGSSGSSKASSSVAKKLSKLKWDGRSIGEITTSQGGKASVQLYTYNGNKYYKSTSGTWYKYG